MSDACDKCLHWDDCAFCMERIPTEDYNREMMERDKDERDYERERAKRDSWKQEDGDSDD